MEIVNDLFERGNDLALELQDLLSVLKDDKKGSENKKVANNGNLKRNQLLAQLKKVTQLLGEFWEYFSSGAEGALELVGLMARLAKLGYEALPLLEKADNEKTYNLEDIKLALAQHQKKLTAQPNVFQSERLAIAALSSELTALIVAFTEFRAEDNPDDLARKLANFETRLTAAEIYADSSIADLTAEKLKPIRMRFDWFLEKSLKTIRAYQRRSKYLLGETKDSISDIFEQSAIRERSFSLSAAKKEWEDEIAFVLRNDPRTLREGIDYLKMVNSLFSILDDGLVEQNHQIDLTAKAIAKIIEDMCNATASEMILIIDVLYVIYGKNFENPSKIINEQGYAVVIEFLKGGYLLIDDDGELYKHWHENLNELRPRFSSHQSTDQQFGLKGDFVKEALFGTTFTDASSNKQTWIQLERTSTGGGLLNLIYHLLNYLQYKFSKKNIGPYGTSKFTEQKSVKISVHNDSGPKVPAQVLGASQIDCSDGEVESGTTPKL